MNSDLPQMFEHVPRRVAGGQNYVVGPKRIALVRTNAGDAIIFGEYFGDLGVEVNFAAVFDQEFSNIGNNPANSVGPDMRIGEPFDFGRSSELDQSS